MMRLLRACTLPLLLVILSLACDTVSAQPQLPVRMRLEPLSIRGRSGGPIPIQIKLEYNRNQIMEGDLVLNIYNSVISNEDRVASIRYEGIVLQGTDYIFNTVLPPIEHSYNKLYQITAWFETETERISLTSDPDQIDPPSPHDLLSISSFERATLMCSCSGERDYLKASANRSFLNRRLTLGNYNPPKSAAKKQGRQNRRRAISGIQDFAVSWDAYNLPEDPLHYCSFDVLLLAEGAVSRLEESQMKAIITWVKAGGSLCVLPDDNRLTGIHLQFLQTLFERDDDPNLNLSITDENTLLVISGEQSPIVNRHFGIGRVTLLPNLPDLPARLTDQHIAAVVGHLWKVRSDSPILKGESWRRNQDVRQMLRQNGYQISDQQGSFVITGGPGRSTHLQVTNLKEAVESLALDFRVEPKPNPLISASETSLLPKGIEMVPTWVIALLLIAYVVTIGPVDYFVLGYFRARKFTWILFPVVTAFFTLLTIAIAHEYMSSTDTGGQLTIVDLGDSGEALRKTDLQMHFYASQQEVRVDASQTFTVPAQMMMANFNQYGGPSGPRPTIASISYSGRFPQSYSTSQQMRQWEPQTVRTLTLAPELADIPAIDWDNKELATTADGRRLLGQMIRELAPASEIDAIVLHNGQTYAVGSGGFLFASHLMSAGKAWTETNQWQRRYQTPNHDAIACMGIIQATAVTPRNDFFDIVSQVSPHGSASMEDMPVLDTSDKSQWLLLIAVRKKGQNHTQVFRRMYHTSSPQLIAVQ